MNTINTSAFHDYDIRGVYPTEINEEFYYHLGKSIALYIQKGPIAVGHDCRLSSPALFKSIVEGITDYGLDVVDLGEISTEIHYFAAGRYNFEANIIVSASHNPPQYNGAKIVRRSMKALHGEFGLPEIKALMNKELPKAAVKGTVMTKNIFNEWVDHALSFVTVNKLKKLTVVVDAGNGMGGPVWQEMMKRLPIIIVPLYLEPDGNFPNHLADPLKEENVADLMAKIHETNADMGIALDGDADRIFFVDEQGVRVSGSITTAIIARYFLETRKGAYLYNAICGRVVPETIKKYGGTPIRTRVGHSFIKEAMQKNNAVFGGEHSGHFYFGDNFSAESSLIAGLLMLEIVNESGKKLSEIRKEFDVYAHSGEINFKVIDAPVILKALEGKFGAQADSVDQLDGLSVWYPDYWFNVRLSKTEPLMRLNIEADNEAVLSRVKKEIIDLIEEKGGEKK